MLGRPSALVAISLVAAASAQLSAPTAPANETALLLSEAQYNASGFDVALPDSQSFNITLNAQALLGINYGGQFITNGQALTASQVATKPTIVVYPGANGTAFANPANFTLILADASAVGHPDSQGDYRHYLANNVQAPASWNASQLVFTPTNGTVITNYAGPGPLVNTGVHRYAWLLFRQPSTFTAPANLSTPGVAPNHWNVHSYVTASGLGELVAATSFTVVNEQNNLTTVATSSVNPATLSVPSSTGSSAAAGATTGAVKAAGSNSNGSATGAASSSFTVSVSVLVGAAAGIAAILA